MALRGRLSIMLISFFAHRAELLYLCGDPPSGASSVLDAASLVIILLLNWLLHRDCAGFHSLPVCCVHIPDVDMHVTGDRRPIRRRRIGSMITVSSIRTSACMSLPDSSGNIHQFDGAEDSRQKVNGCIRPIDDEIRRYRAVAGWLVL